MGLHELEEAVRRARGTTTSTYQEQLDRGRFIEDRERLRILGAFDFVRAAAGIIPGAGSEIIDNPGTEISPMAFLRLKSHDGKERSIRITPSRTSGAEAVVSVWVVNPEHNTAVVPFQREVYDKNDLGLGILIATRKALRLDNEVDQRLVDSFGIGL